MSPTPQPRSHLWVRPVHRYGSSLVLSLAAVEDITLRAPSPDHGY